MDAAFCARGVTIDFFLGLGAAAPTWVAMAAGVGSPGNEPWPDPNPSSALFLWAGADPDPIWDLLFIILIQFGPFYLKSYSYS